MRWRWTAGLSCLIPVLSWAALLGQSLPYKRYSVDQGLLQSTVFTIFQDQQGYLWFGTSAGPCRFDGHSFQAFEKDFEAGSVPVRDMAQESDGTLWFATSKGVVRYDGQQFTTFDLTASFPPGNTRALAIDDAGVLWAALGDGGLVRWENGLFRQHRLMAEDLVVNDLKRGPEDTIWLATNKGLWTLKQGSSARIPIFGEDNLATVQPGHGGTVWVALSQGGSKQAGVHAWRRGSPTTRLILAEPTINDLFEDSKGQLWISTRDKGAFLYDGQQLQRHDRGSGFPASGVNAIFEDHEGGIWFGTYGRGAIRLGNKHLRNYTAQNGLVEPSTYAIAGNRDAIWLTTDGGGVAQITSQGMRTYGTDQGLAGNKAMSVALGRDGRIYIGTLSGLSILEEGSFRNLHAPEELPSDMVFAIHEDRDGDVWIATISGIGCLRAGTRRGFPRGVPGKGRRFNAIAEHADGTLWFAGEGLLSQQGGRFTEVHWPENFRNSYVYDAVVDDHGLLWLATNQGLIRYSDGNFHRFTTADGLSHLLCKALTVDARGHLWIGTLRGIDRFDGRHFQHINASDGLPASEINRGAAFTDPKGNLWFGTVLGVSMLKAGAPLDWVREPPPVHITHLEINGRLMDPSLSLPKLAFHQNDLSLRFTAISFTDPHQIHYLSRLYPLESQWQMGRGDALRYTNLAPGDYRFQVMAFRPGPEDPAAWTEQMNTMAEEAEAQMTGVNTAEFNFRISPPFWQSSWFLWISILVVAILAYLLFRASVRRARLKAEARSAVEANKTKSAFLAHMSHELRTPLNAILGYSEILEEDFRYNHQDEYLEDIRKLQSSAHHLLSLINNILDISKIDSGKMMVFFEEFDAGTIIELVRSTAIPMVRKHENELIVRCGDVGPIRADKAKLRQVLLNLISNANQFTRDGQITLDIARKKDREGQWVLLRVIDTGVGMTTEEKRQLFTERQDTGSGIGFNHNGLGLLISKRFCDMMGAELSVESEPGKGSTFTVKLPAPKAVARA